MPLQVFLIFFNEKVPLKAFVICSFHFTNEDITSKYFYF